MSELLEVIKKVEALSTITDNQVKRLERVEQKLDDYSETAVSIETELKLFNQGNKEMKEWVKNKDSEIAVLKDRSNTAKRLSIGAILSVLGAMISLFFALITKN